MRYQLVEALTKDMDLLNHSAAVCAQRSDERPSVTTAEPAFYFSGSGRTILAEDEGEPLDVAGRDAAEVSALAAHALLETERSSRRPALLVGVVPFAGLSRARLSVPRRVVQLEGAYGPGPGQVLAQPSKVEAPPSDDDQRFTASVQEAVAAIRAGRIRKVVLSRAQSFELGRAPQLSALLRALREREPNAFVFAVSGARPGRKLVGASPELLVSKTGSAVSSRPLAGSSRRSVDAAQDREAAAALLRSAKDRHEHELVVERIVEDWRPLLAMVERDPEPTLVGTSAMWHLASHIRGKLKDPRTSSLELALALHPTPAVCGTPTDAARAFIEAQEPFERGDFTGAIGYMDGAGDGEWVVALRCAELEGARARLFAGAGIVETSDPEAELLETRGKMQMMLEVLRGPGSAGS